MDKYIPYRNESRVAEISRKLSKGGHIYFFHESDLILGSVTNSLVVNTALERLVLVINMK